MLQSTVYTLFVGFKEVEPLDSESKVFTILLILTSIIIFGYVISVLTEYISNYKLYEEFKFKKVQKKINKLKNHTIVCGYGRNGRQAIAKLLSYKESCVIIESNIELIDVIEHEENILYVKGDATDDETLIKAGIDKASSLITTLPSDANNLYVVLSARQLNANCTIVSRASNDSSYSKLKIAGADNVIMPDKIGGQRMAKLVAQPDVVEFIELMLLQSIDSVVLEEISCHNLAACFAGKSISELDVRNNSGANIIGLKREDKSYMINPVPETALVSSDKLFALGTRSQINHLIKTITLDDTGA